MTRVKNESRFLRDFVYFQEILTVLARKFCSHSEIWVLGHYAVNHSLRLEDLSVNLLPFSETLKVKKYSKTCLKRPLKKEYQILVFKINYR